MKINISCAWNYKCLTRFMKSCGNINCVFSCHDKLSLDQENKN